MEVKTKKLIAREILFFVKMAVPTAVGFGIGFLFGIGGGSYLGGFIAIASLAIYPITVIVRLFNWVFNWAKETVNKEE